MARAKRTATTIKQVFHWILGLVRTPSYTVTITKSDDTDLDVSAEIIMDSLSVTLQSIRFGLDSCTFLLNNDKGKYNKTFIGGEIIKVDADYGSGNTRIFKGKLNHPKTESDRTHRIRFFARKVPELKGERIKGTYNGLAVTLVKNIIDDKFSDLITYTNFDSNLGSSTVTIDLQYNDYALSVLAEIFKQKGWGGRLDHDASDVGTFDLEGFTSGSKFNDQYAIVHGQNKLAVRNFGVDTDKIFNNMTVSGGNIGGANIIRTKSNSSSISSLWQKDLEISDSRLTTMNAVDNKASSELTENVSTNPRGNVTAIGSGKMKADYTHWVSSPYDNIHGKYLVPRYTLLLGRNLTMGVDMEKPTRKTSDLILDRIRAEEGIRSFDNKNDVSQSINLSFDNDDDFTLSNLTIEDGVLKVTTGQSSGTLTTRIFAFVDNVSQFDYLLENPVVFGTSTIKVSNDSGSTYTEGTLQDTLFSFSASDNSVILEITLDGSTAELGGIRVGLK